MTTAVPNKRLILIGLLWVSGPAALVQLGGWGMTALWLHLAHPDGHDLQQAREILLLIAGVLLPFAVAWLWWSVNVPKWRLWALERTADWPSLKSQAIRVGLIWDEGTAMGRRLARTEFRTAKHRRRIADLERKSSL